ncbi:MAG: hypothetical protein U0930_10530 [Pirellulales bacterium]
MEPICAFLGFCVIFAVVTVVGHVCWLLVATMWRGVAGQPDPVHTKISPDDPPLTPTQQMHRDLQSAHRLIDYGKYRGWLDEQQIDTLKKLLNGFRQRANADMAGAELGKIPLSDTANNPVVNSQQTVAEKKQLASDSARSSVTQSPAVESSPLLPTSAAPTPKLLGAESATQPTSTSTQPLVPLSTLELKQLATSQAQQLETPLVISSSLHPLDQPEPVAANKAAAEPKPAKPILADLLRTFMERSNIRVIEIVSAALIVVGSVGLVISLWNTLSATSRYFPSLVFLLATLAVHGAGQYTLRKWKLRSTSRGILHIGLMLIPLAVLVGILLSRRPDQVPQFDPLTIGVLLIGTIVYGGLAITASRALFAKRWLAVSSATILGSMTLVAIHFLTAHQQIQLKNSAVALIPIVLATLLNVLQLSSLASLTFLSSGRTRRIAGQVLQVLFAAVVPYVFWVMQSRELGLSKTALACGGVLLAGWSSWGWNASLKQLLNRKIASQGKEKLGVSISWYIVINWLLAGVCSLMLTALVWQAADKRMLLAITLMVVGAWWIVHGLYCGLFTSMVAATIAIAVGASITIEGFLPEALMELQTSDWLTLSRVALLTGSSLVLAAMAGVIGRLSGTASSGFKLANIINSQSGLAAALKKLPAAMLTGSAFVLLTTACLTVIACLTPVSAPAYGGNWAPLILLAYGTTMIGLTTFRPTSIAVVPRLNAIADGVLILGQVVLALAVIRLCHSGPRLPEWLMSLRPNYAWAIGVAALGFVWATLSTVFRVLSDRTEAQRHSLLQTEEERLNYEKSIDFRTSLLSYTSIAAAALARVVCWMRDDDLLLASAVSWIVPFTLSLAFISRREAVLREVALVTGSVWALATVVSIGLHYQWWLPMGVTATVSVLALVQLAILAVYSWFFERSLPIPESSWLYVGPRWARDLLLNVAWFGLIISTVVVAGIQLFMNLNGKELPEKFFVSTPLTPSRLLYVLFAIVSLSIFTFKSVSERFGGLRMWLASAPIVTAMSLSCLVAIPYGIPTALSILSVVVIAWQLLQATNWAFGKQIAASKKHSRSSQFYKLDCDSWLSAVETLSLTAVTIGTVLVLANLVIHGLPAQLSPIIDQASTTTGWLHNLLRIGIWSGPMLLVLGVMWLVDNLTGETTRKLWASGSAFGAVAAIMSIVAGSNEPTQGVALGLKSFSLAMFFVSAATLAITVGRNWLGLRQLDKSSSAFALIGKARKGSRYRSAETAAWNIWLASIVPAVALAVISAGLVGIYHWQQYSSIHEIGDAGSMIIVTLALSLWWLLGTGRGQSKFGLLAITLGLIAPVVSGCYASWLINHPEHRFQFANNFEPVRLQVTLWLASLIVALAIRVYCTVIGRKMTLVAELAWIGLASLIGLVSLVSFKDANWVAGQFALLALVVVISSETSGQTWRGFVSAATALLAWVPWMSAGLSSDGPFFVWQSLISVATVALVALLIRSIYRASHIDIEHQWKMTIDRVSVLVLPAISIVGAGFWALLNAVDLPSADWLGWTVVATNVVVLVVATLRLWQPMSSNRGLGVYLSLMSLVLVIVGFTQWRVDAQTVYRSLGWLAGVLGSMTTMAVLLRQFSAQPEAWQSMLGLKNLTTPNRLNQIIGRMSLTHTWVALICLLPSILLVLTMNQESLRLAAIALPLLGASSILPLVLNDSRPLQRGAVLLLMSSTLVLAWWADLPRALDMQMDDSWLYAQRAFLAFTFLSVAYPLAAYLRKREDAWSISLGQAGWVCSSLSMLIGLGLVLGALTYSFGQYPEAASAAAKAMTIVGWIAIFARLIQFAAWPVGIDRLSTIHTRTIAVYAAEVVIGLACGTGYFMYPELFHGRMVNWWPVIMFAIAFGSTALGQLLHRVNLPVLADPISRSSLLLPLIPLAGVWAFRPERATVLWNQFDRFALLLVFGSCLYGLHGWIRGSVRLRAVSLVLALLGFWSFLQHHPNLRFFEHPQFWLLPPALGTLVFVELNKSRLASSVVTAVRYLAILVAYMSSTSEMFFKAFEGHLWPPLILLALSLIGIIAGIVLKVKPFLFSSMVFLIIGLLGMVRNAAQAIDQNWPWWAFVIVTGISLFAMIIYFEKNRSKILNYLDQIKQWQ